MGEDKRREQRVEAKLALRLAYSSREEFVERYALNVSRGGIFVRARDPKPVGTAVTLDIQLATGEKVVRGKGVVTWTTPPSAPGEPRREPGMGIRFTELDDESRALVDMIASRGPASAKEGEPPGPQAPGVSPPAEAVAPQPIAAIPSLRTPRPASRGPRIVGIDLGTTNCCVAVAEGGRARVLSSRQGWSTIPTVVAYDAHGRLLVGHPARAQMVVNPRNTVYGAKRLMGRAFHSQAVQACRDRFHYDIIEGARGEAAVRFAGREFSLPQISSYLLAEIRDVASQALGEPVQRAVVTVPAYYNDLQRQAVREAGLLAGLHVERIVNEPTAAALAYGHGKERAETILVYDLGGGTFDASVVEIQGDVYEVLSTGGDTFLGGADFDGQLFDHLVFRFAQDHGFLPPQDRRVWQRIRDAAEETKVALSQSETATAHVPYVCKDQQGRDVDLRVEVTREELEQLTGRLVERTIEVCCETLAAKGLSPEDIQSVVLVGGQSRMPLVWKRVREVFGREPSKAVHPDEAVALGAALLADSAGRVDSVLLIDVLPMGIGVGLPGGRVAPILPRNTKLPAKRSYELATVRDGQAELELVVFQGDSPRAAECEYLGTVRVEGLPPGPRGAVKVAVEFALGPEGILAVTARELSTGRITEATLATTDTQADLQRKLQIPEPSEAQSPAGSAAPPPGGAGSKKGLLDRLFGKR